MVPMSEMPVSARQAYPNVGTDIVSRYFCILTHWKLTLAQQLELPVNRVVQRHCCDLLTCRDCSGGYSIFQGNVVAIMLVDCRLSAASQHCSEPHGF